ncbi:MAG: histidine phosphatase family protein [Myxococcota bacterium]
MSRKYDFELLLMRHGEASSWADGGDCARRLTQRGSASVDTIAKAFIAQQWYWSRAFTSTYVRAKQTGQAIYEPLAQEFERTERDALATLEETALVVPNGDIHAAARMITQAGYALASARPRIAVFAHNPLLQGLVGLLVAGDPSVQFALEYASVVHLFVPAPSPFDLIVDPQEEEPLTRAVVLGLYPRHALEAMAGV